MYGAQHDAKNIDDLEVSSYRGRDLPPQGDVQQRPVDELINQAHQRLLDAKAYFRPTDGESENEDQLAAGSGPSSSPTAKRQQRELEAARDEQRRQSRDHAESERAAHLERDPKFKEMQEDLLLNQGRSEQASLAGMSLVEQKSHLWRQNFYSNLKKLLGEVVLHENPRARLDAMDRVYSWYKSKCRAPEDRGSDVVPPPQTTPGFHNFMVAGNPSLDVTELPGSSFYEPPKGDEEDEDEPPPGSSSMTGARPGNAGGPPRPKGLPPARERLREFRTRQLIGSQGPFSARGGDEQFSGPGKKFRDDSPSPERPWSPGGGLYTRPGTATPSTQAPFSARSVASSTMPSRPPTAMEFSRPGTAFDNSRPNTAMGSRPTTAMSSARGGAPSSFGDGSSLDDFQPFQAWGVGGKAILPTGGNSTSEGGAARPKRQTLAERNMEQRWLARRHKEILDKEREEDEQKALSSWAERKARTEEESLRNAEAARFGSVLQRREYRMPPNAGQDVVSGEARQQSAEQSADLKDRPGTAPPKRVDASKPPGKELGSGGGGGPDGQDLAHQMLRQIRKMNAHLLHTIADDPSEPVASIFDGDGSMRHMSLSPYLQRGKGGPVRRATDETEVLQNTCTLWCNKHKLPPGSREDEDEDLSGTVNLQGIRTKQLDEVEKIKRTFGHRNFPVSAQTLERALVMPQQKLKRNVDPCSLLPRLLINPFYESEFKKAKKGGKKKKGRR